MKKSITASILLAALVSISVQVKAESALEQLQQAAGDGQNAVNSYSNGSYNDEGASTYSGYTFDTSSETPPAVDLSGAGDHPTPQLLRNPGE